MATVKQTKTFSGNTGNSEWAWKQTVTESFNDNYITTNKSTINVKTYLTRTNSPSQLGGNASCNIKCKNSSNDEIFNKTVTKTFTWPTYVGVNNWILVQSETFEAEHSSNGSQQLIIESMLNTDEFIPNWTYAYGEMDLVTIPRSSKVTCPSFNIGESTVINIERANNSFTHTLKYVFGLANGPIVAKTTSTAVGWTPNTDIFHGQTPNTTSRKGKIICETYNENNLIGTSECEFTAYVTQANPDVSATIVDTNNTTIALTGDSSKLIRYFSKPQVTISATPKKKATISSYKTMIADGRSSSTIISTFSGIDANGITVYAFDSRGWVGHRTYNPEFVNYIKLAFTSIDIDRTESTSTTVYFKIKGNYYNGSFGATSNTLLLKWRWRKVGDAWSSYINYNPTISGNTFTFEAQSSLVFDNNLDYQFEVIISDKLMSNISTGIQLVKKGTGVIDIFEDEVNVNVPTNFILGDDTIINSSSIKHNNKLLSEILGNTYTLISNADFDSIYNSNFNNGIRLFVINGGTLIGAPQNCYRWGLLINFGVNNNFAVTQIYIEDNIGANTSRYMYVRIRNSSWLKIAGTIVAKTS